MMRENRKRNVKMPQFNKITGLNLSVCQACCCKVVSDQANNVFRDHLFCRQGQVVRFVLTNQVYRVLV